jgi:hypothetical protein
MGIKNHIEGYLNRHVAHPDKISEFSEFIEEFFVKMKDEHEDIMHSFKEKLEDYVYEIDEECAEKVIMSLKRRDGSISGKKWTYSETETVAKQNDIARKMEAAGKKHDCIKFWVAMNYVYAVHYNINRTLNGYIELAIDELLNENIGFEDVVKELSRKEI